jgi:hypothetical protein
MQAIWRVFLAEAYETAEGDRTQKIIWHGLEENNKHGDRYCVSFLAWMRRGLHEAIVPETRRLLDGTDVALKPSDSRNSIYRAKTALLMSVCPVNIIPRQNSRIWRRDDRNLFPASDIFRFTKMVHCVCMYLLPDWIICSSGSFPHKDAASESRVYRVNHKSCFEMEIEKPSRLIFLNVPEIQQDFAIDPHSMASDQIFFHFNRDQFDISFPSFASWNMIRNEKKIYRYCIR